MNEKRIIYTDSTTAECSSVLKMFNFEEDSQEGAFIQLEDENVKAYLVWGRVEYYPDLHRQLNFSPRVQIHFKVNEGAEDLDDLIREVRKALCKLDPSCRVQVFDANSMMELV